MNINRCLLLRSYEVIQAWLPCLLILHKHSRPDCVLDGKGWNRTKVTHTVVVCPPPLSDSTSLSSSLSAAKWHWCLPLCIYTEKNIIQMIVSLHSFSFCPKSVIGKLRWHGQYQHVLALYVFFVKSNTEVQNSVCCLCIHVYIVFHLWTDWFCGFSCQRERDYIHEKSLKLWEEFQTMCLPLTKFDCPGVTLRGWQAV